MNGINEITPNPHIVIVNTAQNAPTHAVITKYRQAEIMIATIDIEVQCL